MRYFILTLVFICICYDLAISQSPPFSSITISGSVSEPFDKVSLFETGKSKTPIKTENINSQDRQYKIEVTMLNDMRKKDDYYYSDMRFWNDKNNNGIKDKGEPISQCHFIIWEPSRNKLYLRVYEGPTYEIPSDNFKYDYKE